MRAPGVTAPAGADATSVHWAQHLDVTNRIEAKALGDARFHQFDDAGHCGFRIVRLHEIEITVSIGI